MSDRPKPSALADAPEEEVQGDELETELPEGGEDDDDLGDLLRRATLPTKDESASLLPGVQKRLRERSRGKFYRDGWSTEPSSAHYATIALVMLVLLAVAYFALGPTGFSAP